MALCADRTVYTRAVPASWHWELRQLLQSLETLFLFFLSLSLSRY